MINSENDKSKSKSLVRIQNLFDLVLAISMTLLVHDLFIPAGSISADNLSVFEALKSLRLTFLNYFISFFILSGFWIMNNQELKLLKKADLPFLWLNLLNMFLLALLPVSTSLKDFYAYVPLAEIVFHINKLLINLLIFFRWLYVIKNPDLLDLNCSDKETIHSYYQKSKPGFITSLIAIGLSFLIPGMSSIVYFIFPVILVLHRRHKTGRFMK